MALPVCLLWPTSDAVSARYLRHSGGQTCLYFRRVTRSYPRGSDEKQLDSTKSIRAIVGPTQSLPARCVSCTGDMATLPPNYSTKVMKRPAPTILSNVSAH